MIVGALLTTPQVAHDKAQRRLQDALAKKQADRSKKKGST